MKTTGRDFHICPFLDFLPVKLFIQIMVPLRALLLKKWVWTKMATKKKDIKKEWNCMLKLQFLLKAAEDI